MLALRRPGQTTVLLVKPLGATLGWQMEKIPGPVTTRDKRDALITAGEADSVQITAGDVTTVLITAGESGGDEESVLITAGDKVTVPLVVPNLSSWIYLHVHVCVLCTL